MSCAAAGWRLSKRSRRGGACTTARLTCGSRWSRAPTTVPAPRSASPSAHRNCPPIREFARRRTSFSCDGRRQAFEVRSEIAAGNLATRLAVPERDLAGAGDQRRAQGGLERLRPQRRAVAGGDMRGGGVRLLAGDPALLDGKRRRVADGVSAREPLDSAVPVDRDQT